MNVMQNNVINRVVKQLICGLFRVLNVKII